MQQQQKMCHLELAVVGELQVFKARPGLHSKGFWHSLRRSSFSPGILVDYRPEDAQVLSPAWGVGSYSRLNSLFS